MKETVWLLIEQQDYESQEVHSVYGNKPSAHMLAALLKDRYGYAFEYGVIKDMATKLCAKNEIYFLSMFTWRLEERAVM